MKRYVAAVASVFGLTLAIGFSYADYFVIKIDLNNLEALTNPPQDNVDPKGGGKGPGGGGLPGGGGGLPGGGGMMGKGGPGGGMMGKGGAGGGMMGKGMPGGGGMMGGKGMPGGGGFGKGGFGGGGMPGGGGGMPGGGGGMPGGGGGALGGGGGALGGALGGKQGIPGGGLKGDGKAKKPEYDGPNHWVYVYLEVKANKWQFTGNRTYVEFDHQFGKKANIPTRVIPGLLAKELVTREYETLMKKAGKDATRVVDLATWALTHGHLKEFHLAMGELKKLNSAEPGIKNILKSYAQALETVTSPLKVEDSNLASLIQELKTENYRSMISKEGHYQILTNLPKETDASLERRLVRLEETFATFFYWFALQDGGPRPEAPKKRLVVVLVKDKAQFDAKHADWGSLPMSADGFTPRRDNLIILSPKRLDDTFALFEKNTQSLIKNFSRDELISGKIWDRPEAMAYGGNVAIMQTLALVHRGLEDESERATITHEGTRQLLAATGLLPRTVEVPEWIQVGMASYFETPYGAVYPGFGIPSWSHLVNFKHLKNTKKLGAPVDVLFNLLNDRYFRQANRLTGKIQDANDKDKLLDTQRDELEKGRAVSWALIFFLAQDKKLHFLDRYFQELNKLPRDLELDERTLQGCFARAFEMADINDRNRIDQARLKSFADRWFSEIANYNLEMPLVEQELMIVRNQPPPRTKTDPGKLPGNKGPGGGPPGGIPGGGPPGGIPGGVGAPPGGLPGGLPGGIPGKQ